MQATPSRVETVMDPTTMSLSGIYAEGLLGLLDNDSEAQDVADALDALAAMVHQEEGFSDLLEAASLTSEQRVDMVRRVFAGRVDECIEGLLNVLARNNRLSLIRGIAACFRDRLYDRMRVMRVSVTAAVELDESTRVDIHEMLEELLEGRVLLTTRCDPDIVGGVLLRIGDRVMDATIAADLERIRRSLHQRLGSAPEKPQRSPFATDGQEEADE